MSQHKNAKHTETYKQMEKRKRNPKFPGQTGLKCLKTNTKYQVANFLLEHITCKIEKYLG